MEPKRQTGKPAWTVMTTSPRPRQWLWAAILAGPTAILGYGPAAADMVSDLCVERWNRGGYKVCEKAVARNPNDVRLRRLFARSLTKAGDYARSIGVFRDVVKLAPNDPKSYYELAWMLAFTRRYKEAVSPIEMAMRLKPDFLPAYKAAAIIYFFAKTRRDVFQVSLKAAELGDKVAMFETAEFYAAGEGVSVDKAKAVFWMERAAKAGHVTAMDRLVDIFLNGKLGQDVDGKKAEYWATLARKARTN